MIHQEKRFTRQLMSYWEVCRGDSEMPSIEKFREGVFDEIWNKCIEIKIECGDYRIKSMGRDMISAYGQDFSGDLTNSTKNGFPGFFIYNDLDKVIFSQYPTEVSGYFGVSSTQVIVYRTCHLPFGNNEEIVNSIVIGLSYKMLGI